MKNNKQQGIAWHILVQRILQGAFRIDIAKARIVGDIGLLAGLDAGYAFQNAVVLSASTGLPDVPVKTAISAG